MYREPVPLGAALTTIAKPQKAQASLALKSLLTQHLLEAVGNGRYQLHAIIIEYAQEHFDPSSERANAESLQVAHSRAAQYYVQQAKITCPPREQRKRVNDIHDLIEAVWQYCYAEQWLEAYNLMRKEGIVAGLQRWGGNAVLLELSQLLLSSDKWQTDLTQVAHFYNRVAELYRILGRVQQAEELCMKGLGLCIEAGDRKGESRALINLANIYSDQGQNDQACERFEQALSICREEGDRLWEGMALNGLAWTYRVSRQSEMALEYYEQALSIRREIGYLPGEAESLSGLGLIYADLGEKEQALKYYEQALRLRQEVGDKGGEGRTLNGLGMVYADLGENNQAQNYYSRSLSIRREIGDSNGEGVTLYNIGKLFLQMRSFDISLASFLLAKKIFDEIRSPNYEATLGWINKLHQEVGDQQFNELLAIAESHSKQLVDQALHHKVQ